MGYHILCIDDDADFLLNIKIQLKSQYLVSTAQTLVEGLDVIRSGDVDLVLLDVSLGQEDGIQALKTIKQQYPTIDVVMVSGHKDPQMIVGAIRSGASDYLCKPYAIDELLAIIEKTQNLKTMRDRHDALIADMNVKQLHHKIISEAKIFKELLAQISCIKGHDANVLLQGESGTGKELLARYVYDLENNPKRPFIAVNCAAIPESLIESELFGHERGAFTGASSRKVGKFELADGGDIFLDEINSLKIELQAKILRVIQEQEVYRVGGTKPIKIHFRVIAATNTCLETQVKEGHFRMDLYHRLRVLLFKIPALRERVQDIPVLIKSFLKKHAKEGHKKTIEPCAIERLMTYAWPGNVRELENLVHSLMIMTPHASITASDLPAWISLNVEDPAPKETTDMPHNLEQVLPLKKYIQLAEGRYIQRVMRIQNGDKSKIARLLGISRSSLYDKIRHVH